MLQEPKLSDIFTQRGCLQVIEDHFDFTNLRALREAGEPFDKEMRQIAKKVKWVGATSLDDPVDPTLVPDEIHQKLRTAPFSLPTRLGPLLSMLYLYYEWEDSQLISYIRELGY